MNHPNPLQSALRTLCVLAIGAALLALSGASASAETRLRKFSLEQLSQIVKGEGYGTVSLHEDHVRFKANGRMYGLYLYDDGDLQMYYGISGVELTLGDVNEWNREYRLSRAYMDQDGDPVLEADLLANAGLNEEMVREFVKVFIDSSMRYRMFVMKHDRSEDEVPASPPASPRT